MPTVTLQTMPAREFSLACLSTEYDRRTMFITASITYKGWELHRDNTNHHDWHKAARADDNHHQIRWLFPILASTRTPGEERKFKTLDAAHNEAVRLAGSVGADLYFTVRTQHYEMPATVTE